MTAEYTKGELTQQAIQAAAYRLFLEQGYHGSSMRQIAQAAGIALASIYNHFPSKENLFQSVLLAYHPFYVVEPVLQAYQGESLPDFISKAAGRVTENPTERLNFAKLMFIELVEFKGQHLTLLFQKIFPRVLNFSEQLVQTNQERLRPIPTVSLVQAFIGIFFSYALAEALLARNLSPEINSAYLNHMIDIYLHGILKE